MTNIPKLGSDEYKRLLNRWRTLDWQMHRGDLSDEGYVELERIREQLDEIELAHSQQEAQRG